MTQTVNNETFLNKEKLPDPIVSENAAIVLKKRYLAKDDNGVVYEDPKDMYMRVAEAVAAPEDNKNRTYYAREFYDIMAENKFLPNSPTLMNAGRRLGMLSACFVIPVEDSLEAIMKANTATALVQRAGGGTGYSFSSLRPSGSIVKSSGGTTAGPLVFIDMLSSTTNAIQQGAFRRGANMGTLTVDHPDIVQFIKAKSDMTRWQNYNVSVSMSDEFMKRLQKHPDADHTVQHPQWGEGRLWIHGKTNEVIAVRDNDGDFDLLEYEPWTVSNTWDLICTRAHSTGEPGLFFPDKVNADNPIKNVGLIETTNPCGEQPLHAWDSCNLGSINLSKFYDADISPDFDFRSLERVARTATRFLDNVIEINTYPVPEIEEQSKKTRRIGLGVMGFADLLFKMRIPYNSSKARSLGASIQEAITNAAYDMSEILGDEKGSFEAWEGSDFGKRGVPMRNSYRTTIAPTGTISIIADCSGGIEPMFSLSFLRQVMKDDKGKMTTMKEVNKYYIQAQKEGLSQEELDRVFVTTQQISAEDHVFMQAAWQEHIDSAVSKTINLAPDATVQEVEDAYILAHSMGCKGITVYRDGCRDGQAGMVQPMSNGTSATPSATPEVVEEFDDDYKDCRRLRLHTQWGTMHAFVAIEDGVETEIFAQIGKGGDLMYSDLEAICRMASCWLQATGSLSDVIAQLDGIGSTHVGVPGPNGRITSIPDALCKSLKNYKRKRAGAEAVQISLSVQSNRDSFESSYGMPCPTKCGGTLNFAEGCKKCETCGYSAC